MVLKVLLGLHIHKKGRFETVIDHDTTLGEIQLLNSLPCRPMYIMSQLLLILYMGHTTHRQLTSGNYNYVGFVEVVKDTHVIILQ